METEKGKLVRWIDDKAAEGTTDQVELRQSFLEGLAILLPDSVLQDNFEDFVKPNQLQMANKEVESEQLNHLLPDWLLPILMNGQIIVN